MTVEAAAARRLFNGIAVLARPPNTEYGFGPDDRVGVELPLPPPLPPLPPPLPPLVPLAGRVEIFARLPRLPPSTPKDNWAPRSRLKLRCAMTMRVSISTCGSG